VIVSVAPSKKKKAVVVEGVVVDAAVFEYVEWWYAIWV